MKDWKMTGTSSRICRPTLLLIASLLEIDISNYRRYIADIDIGFFDIVSVTSKISVIFQYFIILFLTFNVNLKRDNYKISVKLSILLTL